MKFDHSFGTFGSLFLLLFAVYGFVIACGQVYALF